MEKCYISLLVAGLIFSSSLDGMKRKIKNEINPKEPKKTKLTRKHWIEQRKKLAPQNWSNLPSKRKKAISRKNTVSLKKQTLTMSKQNTCIDKQESSLNEENTSYWSSTFIKYLMLLLCMNNIVMTEATPLMQNKHSNEYTSGGCLISQDNIASLVKSYDYNTNLNLIVPQNITQIDYLLKLAKTNIKERIGKIDSKLKYTDKWINSAESAKQLEQDALTVAPVYKKILHEVANKHEAEANFGPGGKFVTKQLKSLVKKINGDMTEEGISEQKAIHKIGDAVRGTIIVSTPEQIQPLIKELVKTFKANGGSIKVYKNLWEQKRPTGYAALHCKTLMPCGKDKHITGEVQLHIKAIHDGTECSIKEQVHAQTYKRHDGKKVPKDVGLSASKAMFLSSYAHIGPNKKTCQTLYPTKRINSLRRNNFQVSYQ